MAEVSNLLQDLEMSKKLTMYLCNHISYYSQTRKTCEAILVTNFCYMEVLAL